MHIKVSNLSSALCCCNLWSSFVEVSLSRSILMAKLVHTLAVAAVWSAVSLSAVSVADPFVPMYTLS